MRKRPLLLAGALVTLGLLASQAPRLFESRQMPPPAAGQQAISKPEPGKPAFLTPREVQALQKQGLPVRIGDVRKTNAYERRHIQGALSLPRKDLEAWGPKLSKEELLILYCS